MPLPPRQRSARSARARSMSACSRADAASPSSVLAAQETMRVAIDRFERGTQDRRSRATIAARHGASRTRRSCWPDPGKLADSIVEARAALACFERVGATRPAIGSQRCCADSATQRGPAAAAPTRWRRHLSVREQEVLEFVRHRSVERGDRARLFISPKTAEHHVGRILTKLGVRSRGEAAALAVRMAAGSASRVANRGRNRGFARRRRVRIVRSCRSTVQHVRGTDVTRSIIMDTSIDEIAPDIFRLSTLVPEVGPTGLSFNQYLIRDEQPFLFHTGMRQLYPLVTRGCFEDHRHRRSAMDLVRSRRSGRVRCDEPLPRRRSERGGGPRRRSRAWCR